MKRLNLDQPQQHTNQSNMAKIQREFLPPLSKSSSGYYSAVALVGYAFYSKDYRFAIAGVVAFFAIPALLQRMGF